MKIDFNEYILCLSLSLNVYYSGNFTDALYHYEKAFQEPTNDNEELTQWRNCLQEHEYETHVQLCRMGVARCSIRVGDFKRGVSILR